MINNQVKSTTDTSNQAAVVQNDIKSAPVVNTDKMNNEQIQSVVQQVSKQQQNTQSVANSEIKTINNQELQSTSAVKPNDVKSDVNQTPAAENYEQHQQNWNQYDASQVKYNQQHQTVTSAASDNQSQTRVNVQSNDSHDDAQVVPKKTVVPTNVLRQPQNYAAIQPRDGEYNIAYGSCNELNQVDFTLKNPLSGDLSNQVQFNNGGGIKSVTQNGNTLTITTNNDIDFQKPMTAIINGQQYTIRPEDGTAMPVVRSTAFGNKYVYNGDDLGATYSPNSTTFKLWAPTASAVSLNLFDNDTDPKSKLKSWTPMKYDPNTGVWTVTINGDLKDTAYDYNVEFADGAANETYDPYATACVEGGFRSVVLSPEEMGAVVTAGKVVDKNDPTDEIIGEIHVRDFTNDPSSGVDSNIRGTYLGAIQPNTTDSKGNPTGLNYLLKQGINTVQIQPMYQYDDDGNNTNSTYQYDWGYDPENYNVPEGWYSTNRDDPATRIKECKEMVQGFHNAGIRVNMDVVYNHVADHGTNALAKTVPGYYFNYGNDGKLTSTSGCGNDVASWRPMTRNYILHSVKYWHDNYGIDGFRFDLMGNLDTTTMNDIRKELLDVVIYGEGWNMGTPVSNGQNADQANEKEMPTIGTFNGWGRTVLRGDDNGKPYGYVTGNQSQQTMSQLGNFIYACQNQSNTPSDAIDGGVNYANPTQVINYAECHDNKTLFDVMKAAHPEESDDVLMRRAELANAITILNEGVPYVQVGQGFGRSKNGDANSYRAPDSENNIHWDTQDNRTWATAYERALIQLRNSDSAFRMTTFDDMNKNMKWVEVGSNNGVIGYELTSLETGKKYIIGYSNNASQQDLTGIPDGDWKVLIKNCNGYLDNPQTISVKDGKAAIPSLSCLVLEQDLPIDNELQVIYQNANGNTVGNYSMNSSKSLGDVDNLAEQHIPSGYRFVKVVSSNNSGNVSDGVQHNVSTVVVEVESINKPTTTTPSNPSKDQSQSNDSNSSQSSPMVIYTVKYQTSDGQVVGSATITNCKDYDSFDKEHCPEGYHIVKIISTTSSSDHPVDVPYTVEDVYEVAKDQTVIPSQNGSSNQPSSGSVQTYTYMIYYFDNDTGRNAGSLTFTSPTLLNNNDLANKVQSGTKEKVDNYNIEYTADNGKTIDVFAYVSDSSNKPASNGSTDESKPATNNKPVDTTGSNSSSNNVTNSNKSASNGSTDELKPATNVQSEIKPSTSGTIQSDDKLNGSSSATKSNINDTNDEQSMANVNNSESVDGQASTSVTDRNHQTQTDSLEHQADSNQRQLVTDYEKIQPSYISVNHRLQQLGANWHSIPQTSINQNQIDGQQESRMRQTVANQAATHNDQVTSLPQTGEMSDVELEMMLGLGLMSAAELLMLLQLDK